MDNKRNRMAKANAATVRANQQVAANAPSGLAESLPSLTSQYQPSVTNDPRNFYIKSGVPKRHQKKLDESQSPDAWVKVRDRVVTSIGEGFIFALVGARGPGKTQIAEQAIRWCSGKGVARSSLYVRAMEVFLRVRACYKPDTPETEVAVVETFCAPQFLVIDEFQERGDTAWEDRMLNYIVDRRYGDMRDTLIIANLTEKAFRESAGPSIVSRLVETGAIIECAWPSMRTAHSANGGPPPRATRP